MNLLKVSQEGKPTKYYLDNVKVSRDAYENRVAKAQAGGRVMHCFHTKIKSLKGGKEKVFQYASI